MLSRQYVRKRQTLGNAWKSRKELSCYPDLTSKERRALSGPTSFCLWPFKILAAVRVETPIPSPTKMITFLARMFESFRLSCFSRSAWAEDFQWC